MSKCASGWVVFFSLFFVIGSAQAATRVKANNATDLNVAASWVGATVPGWGDLAQWDGTVTSANSVFLGANLSFLGIIVTTPGGAVVIGGPHTLTLGCQGVNMSSAGVNLSLTNAALNLASYANPVWTVASGRTLTLNPSVFNRSTRSVMGVQGAGVVSTAAITNGPFGIIGPWATYGTGTSMKYAAVSGGNILGYAAVSAVAGGVLDTTGVTNYDVTAFGTLGPGASFNTLRYIGGQGTVTGAFQANGLLNAGSGALTFKDEATVGADRELVLLSPDTTRTLKLSGCVSDSAGGASGVTVAGGGTVSLTASNAYSGVTVLSSGTLSVSNRDALGATNGNTVVYYSGRLSDGGRLLLSGNITIAEPITIVGGEIGSGGFAITCANNETNTLAGRITISTFNHTRIGAANQSVLNINAPIASAGNSVVLGPNGGLICVNEAIGVPGNLFLHGGPGTVVLNTNGNSFGIAYVQQGNILKLGVPHAIVTNKTVVVGSERDSNTDDGNTSYGRLDLGGVDQTIDRLLGYLNNSGAVIPSRRVITNSVASPSTLTVGSANGSSAYYGIITDGAGAVSLGKIGTGTLLLAGTNTFSGMTTVSGGSLVISNTFALQNSTLTCTNSGVLRFSAGLAGFVLGGLAGTQSIGLTNASGAAVALTVGGNNSDTVYSGALSGGGSLTKVGAGSCRLAFADSSEAWSGTLDLVGTLGPTSLRFGTDESGLSPEQIDRITVNGEEVWLQMNAQGYLRRVVGTLLRLN